MSQAEEEASIPEAEKLTALERQFWNIVAGAAGEMDVRKKKREQ